LRFAALYLMTVAELLFSAKIVTIRQ